MSHRDKAPPGFVRIIGGIWRRHRIAIPRGSDFRPSPDRVRETLFNWLGPVLPGAVCLDLFAGSGVLGFEALSRGARHAVLVERDAAAAAALEAARAALGAEAEIVHAAAGAFLQRRPPVRFDVVFVDPPYAQPVEVVLGALPGLLNTDARVYLERERGDRWPEPAGLEWLRRDTAGGVAFGLASVAPAGRV